VLRPFNVSTAIYIHFHFDAKSCLTGANGKLGIEKFFSQRSTKGFNAGLAQSLDSIRAKDAWLRRDRDDVEQWVKAYKVRHIKSEL